MRNQAGVTVPPGKYQVRLKSGSLSLIQPFNVLIDPRVTADGVTLADLEEQFQHNMRVRELVTEVNQLVSRVREAQNKLRNSSAGTNTDSATSNPASPSAAALDAVAAKFLTEPVRYGKPGLQAHITYLASMTTNVDQKIGRDAIQRYEDLKMELRTLRTELERALAAKPPN